MTTLRDALVNAFSKAETGDLEVPQEVAIETEAAPVEQTAQEAVEPTEAQTAAERARDERGRFAKAEQAAKEQAKTNEQEATQAQSVAPEAEVQTPPPRKPPSSWAKDYWQDWGSLPQKVQDYIERREADFAKGVSAYKNQWDQAAPLYEAVQPFVPELQQYGIQPAQWVQNLGNAHRTLALGTPEQKLQMFAKLATDYGVPLQGITQGGGQVDPQFGHITQTVSALQNRLNQIETMREAEQNALVQREIDQFTQTVDPELFEAAKPIMSQLLEKGLADDLKTAFQKAIRVDDSLWERQQAQEQAKQAEAQRQAQAEQEKLRQAEIAKKKAAAVSPKSSSPTGNTAAGGGKKDRKSLLADAFDENVAGHF